MESSSIPDLRTKATILAAYRDPAANSLAMDAWERIFDIDNAALALDHYQAARLLQTNGDWLGAAEHLRIAITRAGDDRERSLFIAAYVAGLLANNEYSEAELWFI